MSVGGDLVSILVPVFNGEQFIDRTLDSLLAQTHRNFEIVVVDDGSTDGTPAILTARAKADSRIRIFYTERKGPPGARNHAARQASGDFIAPCDSDDLWHPQKLDLQLAALRTASPDVGVSYCWSVGVNEYDEVILPSWSRNHAEGYVLEESIVDSLTGSGSVILVRRSCFEAAGGFPEDIFHGDEWQICISLADICEFALVREYLVGYRLRRDSTSANYLAVEESLARSTHWITSRWPKISKATLRKRAYTVNSYLAFVALRSSHLGIAVGYQLQAFASSPGRIISFAPIRFYFLFWGQVFGVGRYYWRFWRAPRRWEPQPR
jgi:glycosyltransferase involved in cell wall biosynthesis